MVEKGQIVATLLTVSLLGCACVPADPRGAPQFRYPCVQAVH